MLKQESQTPSRTVAEDEGVPSKAIWDPSLSLSSSSSVASTSSASLDGSEEAVASSSSSSPTSGSPTQETDLEDDDNRLSAMLTSSISSAHGPSIDATKISSGNEKSKKIFSKQEDERQRFVQSLSHLSDKQLRIQLWDSFRLARVILGKPVKDKRKLSHKSILHAIRKVAEMKIQIIRMSEELDVFRQQTKRRLRNEAKKKQKKEKQMTDQEKKDESQTKEEKEPQTQQEESQESLPQPQPDETEKSQQPVDSLSLASSRSAATSTSSMNEDSGHASVPSVRDVISDSETPEENVANLRQEAIKVLQEESDLALSQIQEIEKRQQEKSIRKNLGTPAQAAAATPTLFLSPSSSVDEDDFSYTTHESASGILYAFAGEQRSPIRLSKIMASPQATGTNRVVSPIEANRVAIGGDQLDEIRRVLQRVVALEHERQEEQHQEPEITTKDKNLGAPPSSTSQVHGEVISLLTRLAEQTPSPTKISPLKSETEAQQTSLLVANKDNDEEVEDDMEDEDFFAECRAKLSVAKEKEAKSVENLRHLTLQEELLQEDISVAKKNTTPDRGKLQLERLEEYKKQLTTLMKQEEDRAKQMEDLDSELDRLATVCVTLEDTEAEFRGKHERHQKALSEFRDVTTRHTERFRELMGSIDRGIEEQHTIVFGEKESDGDRRLASKGSEESGDAESASAKKIQHLEYLLTKQNIELFRAKAALKANELKIENTKSSACC